MKQLLVVVDMQVDFVTGALGTTEAKAIVENVVKKVKEAKAMGKTVVFTLDTHEKNYMDTQEGKSLPVPHCIRDTEGWELIPELRSLQPDADWWRSLHLEVRFLRIWQERKGMMRLNLWVCAQISALSQMP